MDKLLDYNSVTATEKRLYSLRHAGGSLIKQAAAAEWPPELVDFITKLVPEEKFHYSLCNALGAGEYWSSNVNGDYFESDELIANHPTFLNGDPFMHHINKDPAKGYGNILFSAYNPRMHRVELVVAYDTTKLPKTTVTKLEREEPVNLSMGCRVTHDVCSICGNKAPTPKDYCDHVLKHGLNYVFPDGRKVYVTNPNPDFFDISIVVVPADKTACVLAKIFGATKVASKIDPLRGFRGLVTPSAINAEMAKTASETYIEIRPIDSIPNKSWDKLREIARLTKTASGLKTAIKASRSYFKPNEVQAMLFEQAGLSKIAKVILDNNSYFECKNNVINDIPETEAKVKLSSDFSADKAAFLAAMSGNSPDNILHPISVEDDLDTIMGITPELLDEIARVSMLSAVIGAAMGSNKLLLPAIGGGASLASKVLRNDNSPSREELLMRQAQLRDLYIEPLIRSKKASSNLTLKELYSIPLNVLTN